MHLIDVEAGVAAAVPIVGSTIPYRNRNCMGGKIKNKKNIIVIFLEMVHLKKEYSLKALNLHHCII